MNFKDTIAGYSWPTLYKKTSTGAIQSWSVDVHDNSDHSQWWDIGTVHGQVGGKMQITSDTITKGKNVGKKNETSILQQAQAEAQAKWEKQKKKGYVESIEAAQSDETDVLIEGGIVPMLAHSFAKHAHKIKYMAYVQPKLDGIRCIAILKDGKCTLWSRTRKPITSMPHIAKEIETRFGNNDLTFDGELYNHEFRTNFERIVSMVRQEEPDPNHTDVQYHVYDLIDNGTFEQRFGILLGLFHGNLSKISFDHLKLVNTILVSKEEQIMIHFDMFKATGYEGVMVRNADSKYVNKRSHDLLKVKEFDDDEFDIVGIEEGRGKLAGHVGAFVCNTKDGKTFLAKMSGDTQKLHEYFLNHSLWSGKKLTVQYQGLTGKEGVPRFPVGIAIRDYE